MNNNSVEQPDPDNIKMFVGQVPHDMDENDLRKLFEEFGRVHQINILRDKITGSHRGKCSIDTANDHPFSIPYPRGDRQETRRDSVKISKVKFAQCA
ncbi:hypothetical protein K0M31_013478 [Melipona bicolor]|uniref:RRM domain-containing protein n=1 Tax=Melipona bicolor TaxID=60889 RepID=A0AA40FHP7_9HYME|nr:hypothetical protein K0M31_013478 [Melipona bicolor]